MYLIVDANTSYFALIDRKTLNELGVIVSIPHLKMKFPTSTGQIGPKTIDTTVVVVTTPKMLGS